MSDRKKLSFCQIVWMEALVKVNAFRSYKPLDLVLPVLKNSKRSDDKVRARIIIRFEGRKEGKSLNRLAESHLWVYIHKYHFPAQYRPSLVLSWEVIY